MSEATKKTIPIQDVWMFVWRFLFNPVVIIFSYFVAIANCLIVFFLFILFELLVILIAPIGSLFSRHWLIWPWMKSCYQWFCDNNNIRWKDIERAIDFPETVWGRITDSSTRGSLVMTANVFSLIFWYLLNFWTMVYISNSLYEAGLVSSHGPLQNILVAAAFFGPFLAWGILRFIKKILKIIVGLVFNR